MAIDRPQYQRPLARRGMRLSRSFGQWRRAHRRWVTVCALIVVALFVLLEGGVRIVTPDQMEVLDYDRPPAHHLLSDHSISNPAAVAATYDELMRAPLMPNPQAFWTGRDNCGMGNSSDVWYSRLGDDLTLRFTWHGIPVAVFTSNDFYNPYPVWKCNATASRVLWFWNAGGIPNPEPYADDNAAIRWFPSVVHPA